MTAEQNGRAARRFWSKAQIAAVVVVGLGIMIGAVAMSLLQGETTEQLRLRATTMIPTDVSLADDIACPQETSPSPLTFRSDGALADELVVYEGELIAVRITASAGDGRNPTDVEFEASWPTDVVDASGPVCAFVVDDESVTASLTWDRSGPAAATFDLSALSTSTSTVVEVWLVAAEPQFGATMLTTLRTPEASDNVIIDMLGGRLSVYRRDGTPATVQLTSESTRADDDSVDVVAVVSNVSDDERSFAVGLRLESSLDGMGWTARESLDARVKCTSLVGLECQLPDLGPGDQLEIPFSIQIPGGAVPEIVTCASEGRSVGVCVSAVVTSDVVSRRSPVARSAEILFERTGASSGELSIFTDPPTVVRLPDSGTVARLLVTSGSSSDVTAIEIVGSDCAAITRVAGDADDGDAFLQPEEIWSYDCALGASAPTEFRVEIAGTGTDGSRVTGTFRGTIESVDPDVSFTFDAQPSGRTELTLTNVGRGPLLGVVVLLPGCETYETPDIDSLAEGEQLSLACVAGDVVQRDVVAYGTDAGGGSFVIRNDN